MMTLVCWLNCLLRIITDWCEMLNELLFQITIQVHMCRDSSFVWSLVVSWTSSQASSQIIVSSDFICSSRSYLLIWSHMWAFVLYLCWSVAVILSWNCVHWFQFVIQIQFENSVHKSHRMRSHLLIHSLCYLW